MTDISTTSVVSVRFDAEQRAMLEAAAEQSHSNLSEFIRRKALDAAEEELLGRGIVTIPSKDWDAFEAWLDRPAETIPALRELASRVPTWER